MSVETLQGTTLGRYRLETMLGRGNRASVYQATPRDGGAPVAIRVFDRDLSTEPEFAERFRQRAGALEAVRHPNLLPIIDHGEYQGQAFLVRPYVSGNALRRMLGKPLPLSETLSYLRPIAGALDFAHERGFVHGDVKPGNILLPRSGEVILADLGIAQFMPRGNSLLMAATGRSYGTPEYLAPEQAHALALDGRTDQYALAIILYEALVGRPPFRIERPGDTPRAIASRHITAPPPPPRSLNPALPEAINPVLLRALDKDPARRFPSCEDLIEALVQADPAGARPAPPPSFDDAVTTMLSPEALPARPETASLTARDLSPTPVEMEALEQLSARHASEVRTLKAEYEAQLATQAKTIHEQEGTIAVLTRQLVEVREERERLLGEVATLQRERAAWLSQQRQGILDSLPPAEEPTTGKKSVGQLAILEPQLIGLPRGASFPVHDGTTIGRHPDSTVILDESFVSSHHARISREAESWWIADLGTKNGTYVNGVRINAPTRLNPGDMLRFGRVRASFL